MSSLPPQELRLSVLARQLQPPAAADTLRHDDALAAPAVVVGGLVMDVQVVLAPKTTCRVLKHSKWHCALLDLGHSSLAGLRLGDCRGIGASPWMVIPPWWRLAAGEARCRRRGPAVRRFGAGRCDAHARRRRAQHCGQPGAAAWVQWLHAEKAFGIPDNHVAAHAAEVTDAPGAMAFATSHAAYTATWVRHAHVNCTALNVQARLRLCHAAGRVSRRRCW